MPLISVVVPIFNVEQYLVACLESIQRQTVTDLEVIMVDDGSTDGSAAIAERFAGSDERFRLVRQPNGGLGNARNTGADLAGGEFLSFVDSDDVLRRNAYELLLGALQKTGSDFATGNVHRLTSVGTTQSPFLARTFAQTRLKTHVTEFLPLITDRIVPNKLWRRSFWDEHGYRFPEAMLHEDIPVVVPAQFAARSVDVIAEPVYFYRIREGADLSITQRRAEKAALLDRVKAIEDVLAHLADEGPRKARGWYAKSVVADDLSYYLNVLDSADEEYRGLFLERVNALLDGAGRHVFDDLFAIDKLKWHLVRRRLMPELLEVLRFEKERLVDTPPVRVGRRWYGDYPFRGDDRLGIPDSVYRLNRELTLAPRIDDLRFDGHELKVAGSAFIGGIGAPAAGSQRVTVTAVPPGRLRAVRMRIAPLRFKTSEVHRPELTAASRQSWTDVSWAGFSATLDPRRLRRLGRWRAGTWELYVTVKAGGVKRRRARFFADGPRAVRASDRHLGDVLVTAGPTETGEVTIRVDEQWATVRGHELRDGVAELSGDIRVVGEGKPVLRVVSSNGAKPLRFPMQVEGARSPARFSVSVPLEDLEKQLHAADQEARSEEHELGVVSELHVVDGKRRHRLALSDEVQEAVWPCAGRELSLRRTRDGGASLVASLVHPVITGARWDEDGILELSGELKGQAAGYELVLLARQYLERHVFAIERDERSGHFRARIAPARIRSLAGELPLREGSWDIFARPAGDGREAGMAAVMVAQSLYERLPLPAIVDHKRFLLGMTPEQQAALVVQRNLDDDERGRYHQRRLRDAVYVPGRSDGLRDAVVYSSFGGRQYSDSPRAIHEELVRRELPLEHLWVVRDGMANVPPTARVLREGSRDYFEALARSRHVVVNDHLPDWFTRREDQTVLQTWHGTPLKRLGLDVPEIRRTIRRARRRWDEQVANWQYVLSPNPFSTPILRRAYAIAGEMLETGYPRDDVLAGEERDAATRELRRRLDIPDGARVVLYAPTYRDQVIDRQGRYRLDLHLDVERLRDALGPDTVLLFRKHHYVVDSVPDTGDGFVRDVSSYPDGTELLLAADVLVTDYSSMMFDFANTRRPMLFFTYDLDTYQDEIRGFYFDFVEKSPGPLLETTDQVADALNDLDAVTADYADRYAEFVKTFCALDDGHAAARVVDRLFG